MNTQMKYFLTTALIVLGTLFVVQKVSPLRDLVYGTPATKKMTPTVV